MIKRLTKWICMKFRKLESMQWSFDSINLAAISRVNLTLSHIFLRSKFSKIFWIRYRHIKRKIDIESEVKFMIFFDSVMIRFWSAESVEVSSQNRNLFIDAKWNFLHEFWGMNSGWIPFKFSDSLEDSSKFSVLIAA